MFITKFQLDALNDYFCPHDHSKTIAVSLSTERQGIPILPYGQLRIASIDTSRSTL